MPEPSVAVLGLHGAPAGFLHMLASHRLLSTSGSILESMNEAILYSIPPATWVSWTTIMTGVPPGVHGITGFFHVDRMTGESRLLTALDLEHPRIHEILSINNVESIIVNPVPETPIIPVRKARIISWFLYTREPICHPEGWCKKWLGGKVKKPLKACQTQPLEEEYNAIADLVEDTSGEATLYWVTLRAPDEIYHKCPEALENPEILTPIASAIDRIIHSLSKKTMRAS